MTAHADANTEPAAEGRGLWADAWRRFRRNRFAMGCVAVVAVYIVVGILVQAGVLADDWDQQVGPAYIPPLASYQVIATEDGRTLYAKDVSQREGAYRYKPFKSDAEVGEPTTISAESVRSVKARTSWLGTDFFGQSVLMKAVYSVKISLSVALFASLISIAIGAPLGAIAGYAGRWVDELVVWLFTTFASIPGYLLILAFAVVLRDAQIFGYPLRGLPAVFLALGVTTWVDLCRLVRGEVIKHRERDYVTAAQAYGCSRTRLIFRHIFPNVTHLILIDFSVRTVQFIQAEVILSYLGLGPTDQPSWGIMISSAKQVLGSRGVWWELAAATAFLFVLALAINVVGDALRDALDPKLRQ